jgi:hypothetical protein
METTYFVTPYNMELEWLSEILRDWPFLKQNNQKKATYKPTVAEI